MILYHGSLEIVQTPRIINANRPLDYGSGFYTTTSLEQAQAWVERKMRDKKVTQGYINIYEFDDTSASQLQMLYFDSPTEAWVDFVMANRTQPGYAHGYDIVGGPVANDRVYVSFTLYEGGIIDRSELIHRLKTYRLVDQYLFHTDAALAYLRFINAKTISL